MSGEAESSIVLHPAECGQEILPVVPFDFSACVSAKEHELQRARIGDVRCKVQKILTGPPCTDGSGEGVLLSQKGNAHVTGTRTWNRLPPSTVMNRPNGENRIWPAS